MVYDNNIHVKINNKNKGGVRVNIIFPLTNISLMGKEEIYFLSNVRLVKKGGGTRR